MIKVKNDLTGKIFGHLKVIKQVEDRISSKGNKSPCWLCQCDCGSEPIIRTSYNLLQGQSTNCGCLTQKKTSKNLIGERFGKLVVNNKIPGKHHIRAKWHCICDCGGERICFSKDLIDEIITDCGCVKKEKDKEEQEKEYENMIKIQKENIIGEKFSHLIVKEFYKSNKDNINNIRELKCWWKCKCDCGSEEILIYSTNKLINYKKDNKALSCKKCNWKYFETKNPNNYILKEKYGIGYIKKKDKNTSEIKEYKFYFDLEDYDKIKKYRWYINDYGYIISNVGGKTINLHKLVLGLIDSEAIVDHKNRKPWDNRKNNLRKTTPSLNKQNSNTRSDNNSGIIGVSFIDKKNKWRVDITVNGKRHYYGEFDNFEDAVKQRLIAETSWFEKDYEPQRELFEKYGIVRGK